jgi:hypothetical protein
MLAAPIKMERQQSQQKESSERWNVTAGAFLLQIQLLVGTSIFFGRDCVSGITNVAASLGLHRDALLRATQIGVCSTVASCALFVAFEILCSRRLSAFALFGTPIAMVCIDLVTDGTISSSSTIYTFLVALVASLFYSKQLAMASSTLHVAITATRDKPLGLIGTTCLAVLNVVYLISWGVSTTGLIVWASDQKHLVPCRDLHPHDMVENQNMSTFDSFGSHHFESTLCEKQSRLHPCMIVILVFSQFWTRRVFKSWAHASASNEIGSWWTGRSPRQIRSFTTYLDYICRESLVIPILGLLGTLSGANLVSRRLMARFPASFRQEHTPTDSKWTAENTRFLNSWYFVVLGIYAQNSTSTSNPHANTGCQPPDFGHLRDNRFVFLVIFLCKLSIAMISGCFACVAEFSLLGHSEGIISSPKTTFCVAFVSGFITGGAILTSLEGATKTILVCLAESFPEDDFKKTRLAFELKNAVQQAYPPPSANDSQMLKAAKQLTAI